MLNILTARSSKGIDTVLNLFFSQSFTSCAARGAERNPHWSVCCRTLYEQQVGRQDCKLICSDFPLSRFLFGYTASSPVTGCVVSCGWKKQQPFFDESHVYLQLIAVITYFATCRKMFYDVGRMDTHDNCMMKSMSMEKKAAFLIS